MKFNNECLSNIDIDNERVHNILLGGLFILSYIITFFGYKIIKPVLFLSGASASIIITSPFVSMIKDIDCLYIYMCYLILSFIVGLCSLYIYKLSYFVLGSLTSGVVTYNVYNIVENNIVENNIDIIINDDYKYLIISFMSVLGGCILQYKEKCVSILLTSVVGPILNIYSINTMIQIKDIDIYDIENCILYIQLSYCILLCFLSYSYQSNKVSELLHRETFYLPIN